ncbi:658_t:CDS:1 [Acaulospora morrowiae]|uniref:658_t:CDS:1 n=1 Tax=Acaulospora morrowiae TaxID=94023 RepID=A0A9N9E5S3_9GLOM|nr:658_t:CDS:1 [Acaulospora morrowiae]
MAEEIKTYTPTGRIRKPAYNLIAQWIKDAWDAIDSSLIQRSFQCCGISNARDGSEEHLIFDYNYVTKNNTNSNNNHVYLSNEGLDVKVESIETYLEEKNISVRECEDDYYDNHELNYVNNWN